MVSSKVRAVYNVHRIIFRDIVYVSSSIAFQSSVPSSWRPGWEFRSALFLLLAELVVHTESVTCTGTLCNGRCLHKNQVTWYFCVKCCTLSQMLWQCAIWLFSFPWMCVWVCGRITVGAFETYLILQICDDLFALMRGAVQGCRIFRHGCEHTKGKKWVAQYAVVNLTPKHMWLRVLLVWQWETAYEMQVAEPTSECCSEFPSMGSICIDESFVSLDVMWRTIFFPPWISLTCMCRL